MKLTPEQIALIEGGIDKLRADNRRLQDLDKEVDELQAALNAKGAEQMELRTCIGDGFVQINNVVRAAVQAK